MKKIVQNLLEKQGYNHIALFDEESDVWTYVKENTLYFCNSDLTPIDKNSLGLNSELIALTETNDSIRVIEEDALFQNFMVVDKDNTILVQDKSSCHDMFLLKKWKNGFIIVLNSYRERCEHKCNNTSLLFDFSCHHVDCEQSYTFMDSKYLDDYHLYMVFGKYYFLLNKQKDIVVVAHKEKGVVCKEETPCYLWTHLNEKAHLVSIKNKKIDLNVESDRSGVVEIWELGSVFCGGSYRFTDYLASYMQQDCLNKLNKEFDLCLFSKMKDKLFSNNRIGIPISKYGYDSYNSITINGLFVIEYNDGNNDRYEDYTTAYTIMFHKGYDDRHFHIVDGINISIHNDFIRVDKEKDDFGLTVYEHYFFDFQGNEIELLSDKKKYYAIFNNPNNGLFSEKVKYLQGVIDTIENKVVIPPFFENIRSVDEENGLYEVTYVNYIEDRQLKTTGLYSIFDGFLIPFGAHYDFPYYTSQDYIVFSCGEKKGLIFRGKKVLEAKYKNIEGFNECEKTNTDYYSPLCLLLCEKNKYGLFINTNNIIEPIYTILDCLTIFDGHAYFQACKKKCSIISDDVLFNKRLKAEFDTINGFQKLFGYCFFIVTRNGKKGAICTKERYDIPIIFDDFDRIVRSGVLCGDKLLNRKGEETLILGEDYRYIETSRLDVFVGYQEENLFVFLGFNGERIGYKQDENDNSVLVLDNGYTFDTERYDFIEEEECINGECYDNWDYERDYWNAMTDGQEGDYPYKRYDDL